MQLNIKKIGRIKEADVKLDGLTVIAGNNSTGKSTFSKVLYSIIKTLKKESEYPEIVRKELIKENINFIFLAIDILNHGNLINYKKRFIGFSKEHVEERCEEAKKEYKIYKLLIDEFESKELLYNKIINSNDLKKEINEKIIFLKSIFINYEILPEMHTAGEEQLIYKIPNKLNDILSIINKPITKDDIYKYLMNNELAFRSNNSEQISLLQNGKTLFNYSGKLNILNDYNIGIDDITYIETPMYLVFANDMSYKNSNIIDHNKDLLKKLEEKVYPNPIVTSKLYNNKLNRIVKHKNKIRQLLEINDYDEYTEESYPIGYKIKNITNIEPENKYYYGKQGLLELEICGQDKEEKVKFSEPICEYNKSTGIFSGLMKNRVLGINQTASGIKSFSILQLLEKGGNIRKGNLLILDEPESHLHPEWQLKYAEIVCEMVKIGVKVVINSHSPYLIEALNKATQKEGLANKSNFYLTKENKDGSVTFLDKTEEKYDIFSTLSEPFKKLMFM